MKKELADLFLYRRRYVLGYSALVVLLVAAVLTASIYAPGGLTQAEIDSIKYTNQLAAGNLSVPNLPFHALQLASFSILGVSILSVKLPSIILSLIGAVAMFFLLRRWFKSNVAVLSMLIMTTAGQFIFIGQSATPHILYITLTALILLFASLTLQKKKGQTLWKIALATVVGLSLYTPYFVYVIAGLVIAGLIHPHTRHILFRRSGRKGWIFASIALAAVIAPLIYLCVNQPSLINQIIGSDSLNFDALENIKTILRNYFWVTPIVSSGQIMPIMDFSAVALIILGVLSLFRHRYTARSYMITSWIVFTLPIIIMQPQLTVMITVPLFILLAVGVETLMSEWYKLFPKNPYARGAGLVLIIGLIGVIVLSGVDRFVNGYRHMPEAAREFSTDVTLVKKNIDEGSVKTLLLVTKKEKPLYDALADHNQLNMIVSTELSHEIDTTLVTRAARHKVQGNWSLQKVITNELSEEGDRLYLYKLPGNEL